MLNIMVKSDQGKKEHSNKVKLGCKVKGKAYGICSIRVDGNDALAVYSAVHTAREIAIREKTSVLMEVH